MSSILEVALTSVIATVQSVPGMAPDSVVARSLPETFKIQYDSEGVPSVVQIMPPPAYPGAVVSVDDRDIRVVEVQQAYGASEVWYEAPVHVTYAVTSPSGGVVAGDARLLAWAIGEAGDRKLMLLVAVDGAMPLRPESIITHDTDATTHVVTYSYTMKYPIIESND